jgi:hypothetical protein
MGSQENSRKRSEHARRQKRDAYRRFSSAAEPVPEAGARREKKKRSTAVRAPEASARQEKHSAAVRAPVLSTAAAERSMRASDRREKKLRSGSGSGVVAKQKKTINLMTSTSDESSSSDKSAQLRPVEQLKPKEKKVSKHSLVLNMQVNLANQMMLLSMLSVNVILG